MTFFQDFPVPPRPAQPRATRYIPPPWAGAPAHELPVAVNLGRFLHLTPTVAMTLKSADVYSTGCLFNVGWLFRRGEQDEDAWSDLHHAFFQPGMGHRHGSTQNNNLMFGVEFPDGSRASTAHQPIPGFMEPAVEPEPPVLALHGGGGSGGDDELSGSGTLWLWPLPPAGDLRLVAQWTQFDLAETSVMLDGGALRDAAAGVQRFFPEEDTPER